MSRKHFKFLTTAFFMFRFSGAQSQNSMITIDGMYSLRPTELHLAMIKSYNHLQAQKTTSRLKQPT